MGTIWADVYNSALTLTSTDEASSMLNLLKKFGSRNLSVFMASEEKSFVVFVAVNMTSLGYGNKGQ